MLALKKITLDLNRKKIEYRSTITIKTLLKRHYEIKNHVLMENR